MHGLQYDALYVCVYVVNMCVYVCMYVVDLLNQDN